MVINQNILAILRTFANLKKIKIKIIIIIIMRNFTSTKQLPKLLLLNFLPKFLTKRKHLMNNLTFSRQKYL